MKSLLFTDPMVRAILEGRKTMTRRIVKPQPVIDPKWGLQWKPKPTKMHSPCYCQLNTNWNPITKGMMDYGSPLKAGETFYVREAWAHALYTPTPGALVFRASSPDHADRPTDSLRGGRWRSPLHLREADARLFLRCTDVRAERVHDISEEDARAEGISWVAPTFGVPGVSTSWGPTARHAFAALWVSIHGSESWESNPWVWIYQFEKF